MTYCIFYLPNFESSRSYYVYYYRNFVLTQVNLQMQLLNVRLLIGIFTAFNTSSAQLLCTVPRAGHQSQKYTKSSEFRFFPASLWRGQEYKHPQLLKQEGTLVHQQNQTGNTKWAFLLFILRLLGRMKFMFSNHICQKSTENIRCHYFS